MGNIKEYLKDILEARYGKEVRGSIHDAIEQCYKDGKAGAIDLVARERIDALESSALVRKIVDSLPTSNISTTTVYMIPNTKSSEYNIYDEYMYINESWEKIGSSAVDLTDYLKKDGDSANNTVTFTSGDSASATEWIYVGILSSGEKHSSFLTKISTMFKNIRFLKNFLGDNDISGIGDGTVTGALRTLNDSLNGLKNSSKQYTCGVVFSKYITDVGVFSSYIPCKLEGRTITLNNIDCAYIGSTSDQTLMKVRLADENGFNVIIDPSLSSWSGCYAAVTFTINEIN